jgi:hypothetical protein
MRQPNVYLRDLGWTNIRDRASSLRDVISLDRESIAIRMCEEGHASREKPAHPVVERLIAGLDEPLEFCCPTVVVNTDNGYQPTLEAVISQIDTLYSRQDVHDLDRPSLREKPPAFEPDFRAKKSESLAHVARTPDDIEEGVDDSQGREQDLFWWALRDSNPRPQPCEGCALTS